MSQTTYSDEISQERQKKERRRFRGIRNFWSQYRRSKFGLTGLALFVLFFLAALLAPWIAPYEPNPQGQFPKVHPQFAEPAILGLLNPEASKAFNFATTEGRFEFPETTTISEFNNTNGWLVKIQKSSFILAVHKTSYLSIKGNTEWEDMTLDEVTAANLEVNIGVLKDPFDPINNKALRVTFQDNGAQPEPDYSLFGVPETSYRILRNSTFYRIRIVMNQDWNIAFEPKELLGFQRYMVLGPQDDFDRLESTYSGTALNDTRNNLNKIYQVHPNLNVNRTIDINNEYVDNDVKINVDFTNLAYWEEGSWASENCQVEDIIRSGDQVNLKCEKVIKNTANLPYYHGAWSFPTVKKPLVDNADIPTKPTDRFQMFSQEGMLEFGLNFEFRQNNTQTSGRYDIIIDDFFLTTGISFSGVLGADFQGQDVLSILIWGGRASLTVGIVATLFSLSIGIVVGLASGYAGGLTDDVIMRFVDFLLIMPGLPLLLALAAILRPSIWNLIVVIAALGWPGTARLIRSQVLVEKEKAYVESAKAAGASDTYILFKHILPNVLPLVFAIAATQVSGAILSLAALDYLGLGDQFIPSWGIMLLEASASGAASAGYWWLVVTPGAAIAALSLAFALMGYTTQQIINPRLRSRGD